jgi:hypothetical protein
MPASPTFWRRWVLGLMLPTSLALFWFARSELRGFNACRVLRTRIDTVTVRNHSDRPNDLDLFAPIAVAVVRSKIAKIVEQGFSFDCAATLFRLWWISPENNELDEGGSRP